MNRMLDTNACIKHLHGKPNRVRQRMSLADPKTIFICSVVKFELVYGAFKSAKTTENLELLESFFANTLSLPFDNKAAAIAGEIRARLAKTGKNIGPYDVQIAAIALANDMTLVTNNVKEFSRVPNLKIEDWESV